MLIGAIIFRNPQENVGQLIILIGLGVLNTVAVIARNILIKKSKDIEIKVDNNNLILSFLLISMWVIPLIKILIQ